MLTRTYLISSVYVKNKNTSIFISYLFVNRKVEISKKSNQGTTGLRGTMRVKDRYIEVILPNIFLIKCEMCFLKNKIPPLPKIFLKYSTADNRFELFCIPLILLVIKVKQLTLFIMLYQNF